MATKQFKFIPRTTLVKGKRVFADNRDKRNEIIEYLKSMTIHNDADGKIIDYEDFFFFNNINQSFETIMRNEDAIKDRTIKANVHTIVSSSKTSDDLAFIADNLDSVIESMRENMIVFGNGRDFKSMTAAAKAWEDASTEAEAQIAKLSKIVNDNLKKGYGSKYQLRKIQREMFEESEEKMKAELLSGKSLEEVATKFKITDTRLMEDLEKTIAKEKFEESREKITELFAQDKTPYDIAIELDLRTGLVNTFVNGLMKKKLGDNIDTITAHMMENKSRLDSADELNVSVNALKDFIKERNLVAKVTKAKELEKEKVIKAAKAEKKTNAETKNTKPKVETTEVKPEAAKEVKVKHAETEDKK